MNINNAIYFRIKSIFAKKTNIIPENWHEDFIVHLAKVVRPKVYVELGLYQSALFNKMIPYADKLIGVDLDASLEKYMKKSPKTKFVAATTDAFAKQLKKKPIKIDMLFIDANHSKEAVKKDFKQFFPFIAPHGLIILHDGHPKNREYTVPGYCGDGYKAIEEFSKNTKDYEMVTLPVHPGVTICRKRKKQLKWEEK